MGHFCVGMDHYRTSQGCGTCLGHIDFTRDPQGRITKHQRVKKCTNCQSPSDVANHLFWHRDVVAPLLMARLAAMLYAGEELPEPYQRPVAPAGGQGGTGPGAGGGGGPGPGGGGNGPGPGGSGGNDGGG